MGVIINRKQLAASPIRKDALKIIESAYEAIDIKKLTRRRFKVRGGYLEVCDLACREKINLADFEKIFVVGFGKGSYAAVSTMADVLGKKLSRAIALDVHPPKFFNEKLRRVEASCQPKKPNRKVKIYWGTHPEPSKANVRATSAIVSVAKGAGENDLVIYFIGGGGSSLLCGSLGELKYSCQLFGELTKKGAAIEEMNIVRKHISEVKGGNLAKFTYPALSLSLIVSDVCGNPLGTIASGPTVYDKTTKKDAEKIINKYLRKSAFRSALIRVLRETPKDKHYFDRCKYFLLACNEDAALAMLTTARRLGYSASIGSLLVKGEAKNVIFPFIKRVEPGQVMALAGETTVKIRGKGKGGRNQELALSVLEAAFKKKLNISKMLIASFASDGFDNTPVAGAIADNISLKKAVDLKLNPSKYLSNNDSYSFFQKTGDYICVKRKSFNVADLMVILRNKS